MKKITVLTFLLFSVIFNQSFAQSGQGTGSGKGSSVETGVQKGWPSSERTAFITQCIKTAKTSMSEDSARQYCYCMQEKVEAKYPSIDDANKITKEDLGTPEWKKEISNCLTESHWTTEDREGILTECIKVAKENIGEAKAKSYCECMLFKIEKLYPNPADASAITPEKLATPEWKKIIQGCLDF